MSDEAPVTILVVDDNPATLYSTARVLRSAGWTVLAASSGEAGLAIAASRELSLIVLDINLPDIDGFEICRRLRADKFTAATPVVHLSASFVNANDKVHGLEGGAVGYLTHPVAPPVLLATIRAFLRTRRGEIPRRVQQRYQRHFAHDRGFIVSRCESRDVCTAREGVARHHHAATVELHPR